MSVRRRGRLALWLGCLALAAAGISRAADDPAPAAAQEIAVGGPERDASETFFQANAAYEAGDYATAIGLYRKLASNGWDGGHLHYNLGNAYLRNGELGRAIASYRRSRLRLPREEDVRANLIFARKSSKDAIAPPEPSAVQRTLFFWHYAWSPRELAVAALALNLLFWAGLALRLRWRRSESLRWILWLLLVPLLATTGSTAAHRLLRDDVAVVVPQEVDALTAPEEGSVVRFKLHAGTELRIGARRQGWVRVVLPDGQQGWVEASWVEIVS